MKQTIILKSAVLIAVLFSIMAGSARAQRASVAENTVAIMPIIFIGEGNEIKMEEMRYRLQHIAHQFLVKDAIELKFQDPEVTNSLLLKNGVTKENFRQFTPQELADLLAVEYIVLGSVTEESGTIVSHHHEEVRGRRNNEWNNRNRQTRNGSSTTSQQINTTVELGIYNDNGQKSYP